MVNGNVREKIPGKSSYTPVNTSHIPVKAQTQYIVLEKVELWDRLSFFPLALHQPNLR